MAHAFIANGLDLFLFSEACWGKAMVAYTMPLQRKKEESERLRVDRDQIKFITAIAYYTVRQITKYRACAAYRTQPQG